MNSDGSSASWSDWVEVLNQVLERPASVTDQACPTCGAKDLHIAFTAATGSVIGYASFWCGTSGDGIFTSRLRIPPGVPVVPLGLSAEERRTYVPDFHIIPPAPDDDSESMAF